MIQSAIQPLTNPQPDFLGPALTMKTVATWPAYLPRAGSASLCGQRIVLRDAALVVVDDDAVVRGAVLDVELGARE